MGDKTDNFIGSILKKDKIILNRVLYDSTVLIL